MSLPRAHQERCRLRRWQGSLRPRSSRAASARCRPTVTHTDQWSSVVRRDGHIQGAHHVRRSLPKAKDIVSLVRESGPIFMEKSFWLELIRIRVGFTVTLCNTTPQAFRCAPDFYGYLLLLHQVNILIRNQSLKVLFLRCKFRVPTIQTLN